MWEAATKRHDYKEGDVDAPFYNTYGSGSWYIHAVGEYWTNYVAPSFAAAGHTLALKDGSMEESLPIFSIAGIIFILCSMANLVSAIAFKHAMDRDTTSPVTLAGSNATSTDKHQRAEVGPRVRSDRAPVRDCGRFGHLPLVHTLQLPRLGRMGREILGSKASLALWPLELDATALWMPFQCVDAGGI